MKRLSGRTSHLQKPLSKRMNNSELGERQSNLSSELSLNAKYI